MAFIYLASPYTHLDPFIRQHRYVEARAVTGRVLRSGFHVYSPIVHCHDMALHQGMPTEFAFWEAYNFAMLDAAEGFAIIEMDGWGESKGVWMEQKRAYSRGLKFYRCDGNTLHFVDNPQGMLL